GVALGIYSADCVAILLVDPRTGVVGAMHAGWRGTAQEIARKTVDTLVAIYKVNPADLCAAMGPSIGPCCFEVGPEVAAQFPSNFVRQGAGKSGKATVDLRAANRAALLAAGMSGDKIDSGAHCTSCDRTRFFSFRRDGRETGQHVAFVTRV